MTLLDADSQALLTEVLPRYSPSPGMDPGEARRLALELGQRLQGEPEPMDEIRDLTIPGPAGPVPLRFYRPADAGRGWWLWVHGGGFMTGGLDSHDLLCRRLAAGSGQVVISIDYRLAPENPWPAALMDCVAAMRAIRGRAVELGLDPGLGAVGGSSAGGNLAAALVLALRAEGDPAPVCQTLVYPAVDATGEMMRRSPHGEGYQLTAAMMQHYLDAYCGACPDRRAPLLSPLHAADLAGLPPALVVLAELDPLFEEGAAYADRLRAAGTATEVIHYPGVMHGFFAQAGALAKARDAQGRVCAFVRDRLVTATH